VCNASDLIRSLVGLCTIIYADEHTHHHIDSGAISSATNQHL
jgi:hypothetical protein